MTFTFHTILNLLTLSSIQRKGYILDVHARYTTSENFLWSWEMLASCRARTLFSLSCQTPFETFKLKSLHQLTVRILPKLIEVLTLDSKENSSKLLKKAYLCFWYLVQLKAEERFIIEKIVERRDVFGQLIEESNLPNVAYKLGGLKIVRC